MTAAYDVILPTSATRAEWLAARKAGIGGSDAPAVLGWGGYHSPLEVYASKVLDEHPDEGDDEARAWGRILEDVIAREAARRNLWTIRRAPLLVRSRRWPWMLASVDRMLVNPPSTKPAAILECKNRIEYQSHNWDDGLPLDVAAQTFHYLAVYGLPVAHVACLIGGRELRTYRVDADDALLADIAEAERVWWTDHVDARRLPDLTVSDDNNRTLSRLYGEPVGAVELDADGIDLLRRRRKTFESLDGGKKELAALDDEVRLLLGEKIEGHIGGKKFVSWAPSAGSRKCDYDRLQAEFSDAYEACVTTGEPTRRLNYSRKDLP